MKLATWLGLSARLLIQHSALLAGVTTCIAITSLIAGAEVTLVVSLGTPGSLSTPGLTDLQTQALIPSIQGIVGVMAGLTVFIAGLLMSSAFAQALALRQRERAVMRLAGAGRRQLKAFAALESASLGFLVALPLVFLGRLLAAPLFKALLNAGMFTQGMVLKVSTHTEVLVLLASGIALVAGLAGFRAAGRSSGRDLLADLSPSQGGLKRLDLAWRILLISAAVLALTLVDPAGVGGGVILLIPAIVVIPLIAAAPLVTPVATRLVGSLVGLFAGGPALLARQRASQDRVRFARSITPLILATGFFGGFLVSQAPDDAYQLQQYLARMNAPVIAIASSSTAADQLGDGADARGLSYARETEFVTSVDGSRASVYFGDAEDFATLTRQTVLAGDLAKVGDLNVASSLSGAALGARHVVVDADGNDHVVTVVAILEDEIYEGLFLSWSAKQTIAPDPAGGGQINVFLASPATTQGVSEWAPDAVDVLTPAQFANKQLNTRHSNSRNSNLAVFGTIYLMAVVAMLQGSISVSFSRRREFMLLNSLGVGRAGVVWSVAIEGLILVMVAGIVSVAALLLVGWRFANGDTDIVRAMLQVVPTILVTFAALSLVQVGSQAAGAALAAGQTHAAR